MEQEREQLEGELLIRLLGHLMNLPWTNLDSSASCLHVKEEKSIRRFNTTPSDMGLTKRHRISSFTLFQLLKSCILHILIFMKILPDFWGQWLPPNSSYLSAAQMFGSLPRDEISNGRSNGPFKE